MHKIIFAGRQNVLLVFLREYVVTSGRRRFCWFIVYTSGYSKKKNILNVLWAFFSKLLVRTHIIYNIHVKLQTNSACLSKTFSNFMLPESLIKTQAWINMLDQFHSSLCRKQFFCNQEKFRKTCENLMFKLNDSDNRKFVKD